MSRSHKDFVAMIELGEGDHEYKFLVDGQWITDSGAPTVENNSGKIPKDSHTIILPDWTPQKWALSNFAFQHC